MTAQHTIDSLAHERQRLLRLMCKACGIDVNAPIVLFDPSTPGYDELMRISDLHSHAVARYNEERISNARREVRRILHDNKQTQRLYSR